MEGQRSSLVLEAIRLISECRPSVFVWENVKGTFSSNDGADFWAIIQAFADIGGYRLEWQLLNTSWFLPQNRERIYLVGYSTATGGDWRGVFPIAENNKSNTEQHGVEIVGHRGTGGQQGFIYGEAGIAPTLSACCYKDPTKVQVKQIGTRLDSNSGTQPYQQDRVYDADGIVPALNQGKSDLILRVKSATNSGYEEATSGDTINLSQPNSETRRGRVGKQKAQTLETSCNQAVVENYRIRRLTPIECERLQGFPDQHTAYGNYDGEVKPMSNTQRYRQCGNAVTVDVVAAVAKKCLSLFN
jgi:DNA (cytosine-5)-methyltransferase 1